VTARTKEYDVKHKSLNINFTFHLLLL